MKTTGNGHLFKRNGVYYLQYDVDRNRKKKSLHTKSKIKAEKIRDDILKPALTASPKEQVLLHIAEARKIVSIKHYKTDQVWTAYMNSPSRPDSSPGTLGNYQRNWIKFKKWLADNYPKATELSDVSADMAEEYTKKLWKDGISANTFNYHLQSLKLIIKILTKNNHTPFSEVKRKNDAQEHRRNFSKEEILNILSAFENKELDVRDKLELKVLCYLGAYTPLRLIDCCLLKWENVHLSSEQSSISLTPRKTRKFGIKVSIPVHESLKAELDNVTGNDSEYVLPRHALRYKINPDSIVDDFKKILTFCGFKELNREIEGRQRLKKAVVYGFHSFKHSYATFAANAGISINTLSNITGTNIRTLEQYYIHPDDKLQREIFDALPNSMESTSKKSLSPERKILSASSIIKNSKQIPSEIKKQLLSALQ